MKPIKYTQTNAKTGKSYTYWMVYAGSKDGKRIRKSFRTREEATRFCHDMATAKNRMSSSFSEDECIIASKAFRDMRGAGFDAIDVLSAIDEYIKRHAAQTSTIEEAYERYLGTFSDSQVHKRLVKYTVGAFTEFAKGMKLTEIEPETVQQFLNGIEKSVSPKTYNSHLNYIKTFFGWANREKLVSENPVVMATKRIAYKDPEFIKPGVFSDVMHILDTDTTMPDAHRRRLITVFVLSFFCGIRSSEIARLTPDSIHPEDKVPFVRVSITKGASKGVKGRIVNLEPNAAAWLKKYPIEQGNSKLKIEDLRREAFSGPLKKLAPAFTQNIGRHSYITYHAALYRNYALTESQVGTSSSMRVKHYQGLATTADAERYFSILPLPS